MMIQEKIQVARDFVGSHKDSNIDNWQPLDICGDNKWLAIYENIINGVYGECRTDGEYFEVEISSREHIDNCSALFSF